MLINDLMEPLSEKKVDGSENPDITSIAYDSRSVVPGALFVCIRGENQDGNAFIDDSLRNGAIAVLTDRDDIGVLYRGKTTVVTVPNARRALPILASRIYKYPTKKLKLIGVTGTKGKTTTTYLVQSVLEASGLHTGIIGTLGSRIGSEAIPHSRTTPESVDLQALFDRMVSEGVSAAAMEVSSHALALGRTDGCEYDVGVFTNLTHDHLDFHHSMDEYLDSKLMLFREYPGKSDKRFTGVVNIDDPRGEKVRQATCGEILTYGIYEEADIHAHDISAGADGVSFVVSSPSGAFPVRMALGGKFNIYNALAAAGAGIALGLTIDDIRMGLQSLKTVPGRFESVDCGQDFGVVVDYAHTPDSLENILKAARELTSSRLIVVFGCGGDRDRTKRPEMGKIGAELADVCIITSDNPRSEDPEEIICEVLEGIDKARKNVVAITDRMQAIQKAIETARAGDLVVIAGKGHETYQIFKDETIHFDDCEVVKDILRKSDCT